MVMAAFRGGGPHTARPM
uniref:Uncharacterized protein n=1 Tax=Arundo donax TaxID=35708 RepID=A0A0A9HB02_ARUDO